MNTISGSLVKGYELKERIGAGGFGVVYRAEKSTLGREVAVKVILPGYANKPDFIRRFETEAQLVARLEHIHIVPLYDYWRDPEGAYLVMRLLRGGSLQNELQNGPYNLETAAILLEQVASALAVAHRNQIVHRDIKPSNILLDEDGNAYLTDFGIAKVLNTGVSQATEPGEMVGSPDYLAPEQARSEPITPQTDIYSMGVVLYEMITGEHPFKDGSTIERLFHHINDPLPPIVGLEPDVTEGINQVIQKATAKKPGERYKDILTMAGAFREAAGLTVSRAARSIVELLTPREQEVLKLIIEGRSNREIAQKLVIESSTVKWYVKQIYKKLNVRSRVQAIVKARELNLIVEDFASDSTGSLGTLPEPENPYKGLRAFQAVDEKDFHGRDRLVQKLLSRMASEVENNRFLAVVGPSGSGKSSLVKAGLVPALWRGDLPGSDNWFIAEMMPGPDPLEELETALVRIATENGTNLIGEYLHRNANGLFRIPGLILPDDGSELVLVIDQFEEVFTLVEDENERQHFLDLLVKAVTDERSRVRVIVTLRADFYDRPLRYAEFGMLLHDRVETVLPLSADELEQAIVQPARRVGVLYEDGLVPQIIDQMLYQPGMLPLLQYALTELFEVREDRLLTLEGYQQIGSAVGALGTRAEEIYREQSEDGRELVRQIFLRLVMLGDGKQVTRRRTPQAELLAIAENPDLVEEIIDTFTNYRLLSLDHDPETRVPTVEVAHEAILEEWESLRGWLEQSRGDIRRQRQLARAAGDWERSEREASFLLRGARLETFETWREGTDLRLTGVENDFLDASIAGWKLEEVESAARAERERQLEKRSRAFLRALVGVFAAATIIAFILSGVAFNQRSAAQNSAATATHSQGEAVIKAATAVAAEENAQTQAQIAQTAQADEAMQRVLAENAEEDALRQAGIGLASQAILELNGANPERAVLLALEAIENYPYSWQTRNALARIVVDNHIRLIYDHERTGGLLNTLDMSNDGKTIISFSDNNHTIHFWDSTTGDDRFTIEIPDQYSADGWPVLSPDGKSLLDIDNYYDTGEYVILMWDVASRSLRFTADLDSPAVWASQKSWSPNGDRFLTRHLDGSARIFDAYTGELLFRLESGFEKQGNRAGWSPYSSHIYSTFGPDNIAVIWNADTGEEVFRFPQGENRVYLGDWAPSGDRFAMVLREFGEVREFNLFTGEQTLAFSIPEMVDNKGFRGTSVSYSPDGTTIFTTSITGQGRVWDAETGSLRYTIDYGDGSEGVSISPDWQFIATSKSDGSLRVLDFISGNEILTAFNPEGVGSRILWTSDSAGVFFGGADLVMGLDLFSASIIKFGESGIVGLNPWVSTAAWSPDGKQFGRGFPDGSFLVWDAVSGEEVMRLEGGTGGGRTIAWSPSGDRIFTGDDDGSSRIWDAQSGELLVEFSAIVVRAAWSPDGTRLVTNNNWTLNLEVWDAETGELRLDMQNFNEPPFVCGWFSVWSPDGSRVATSCPYRPAFVWDPITGEVLYDLLPTDYQEWVDGIAWSHDGKTILVSVSGQVMFRNAENGTLLKTIQGDQTEQVRDLLLSFDDSELYTCGSRGIVRGYEIATGNQIAQYDIGGDTSCALSPDGTQILVGSSDGTTRIYPIWGAESLDDLIAYAKECCVLRELTLEERERFGLLPSEEK